VAADGVKALGGFSDAYNSKARLICWTATFLAVLVFVVRGPYRALMDAGLDDLLSPYIQSSALLHGADPYSCESVYVFWPSQAAKARPDLKQFQDRSVLVKRGFPTAYPLTALAVIAPFTVIPWPIFKLLFLCLVVGLFVVTVFALVSLASLRGRKAWAFIVVAFLLAPFHTGIATCNLVILSIELGVIGIWLQNFQKYLPSGVLIAISVAIKPPIGLVFLAFALLRHRWRMPIIATALLAIAMLAPTVWLYFQKTDWIASYKADTGALLSTGTLGDFTERNPLRFGLVNLQVALYPLIHDRSSTNRTVAFICGLLFVWWVVLALRAEHRNDGLYLSLLAVIALLSVYHRFYDAAILLIPVCYLINDSDSGVVPKLGLIATGAFLLPGGTILENLDLNGHLPLALAATTFGQSVVMAHAIWCLVILCFVLLYLVRGDLHPLLRSHG